jgi:MFS family permease
VCAGGLVTFALHERRAAEPVLPLHLLRGRTIGSANLAGAAVGAAMFGTIAFVPLFVQGVLGSTAAASGLVMTPLLLGLMVSSLASGQIIARTGRYRWALLGGPALMLSAFTWLASMGSARRPATRPARWSSWASASACSTRTSSS